MTTTLHADGQVAEVSPSEVILRDFPVEEWVVDGRTVDVRIVPYGVSALVRDGDGPVYREEWLPGVFGHQLNAANRVYANFEHEPGIRGIVGQGILLREERDGFHGSFRLHDTADGDKAKILIEHGGLDGVSLEAVPVRNKLTDTVVQRVKANLRGIAFCRNPAFTDAKVLAVREAPTVDPDLLPLEIDPVLLATLRRQGIKLPARYEAHPDETGTPETPGTPEDGTRPSDNHQSEGTDHGGNPI